MSELVALHGFDDSGGIILYSEGFRIGLCAVIDRYPKARPECQRGNTNSNNATFSAVRPLLHFLKLLNTPTVNGSSASI
jgi:hypothetical protein